MGTYVVNSKKEQQELLTRCGLNSFVDLYKDIPEEVLLKDGLNLPKGLAELEVKRKFEDLADKNKVYKHIFRGAGAYNHYIPSVVKAIASKEEFVTAGGIALNEVDAAGMESKLKKGIYFAGEILDIDGVTGGFNFQNAWTTGYLAAQAIAKASKE